MALTMSCYDQALRFQQRSRDALEGWTCLVANSMRFLRARPMDVLLRSHLALRPLIDAGVADPVVTGSDQLPVVSPRAAEAVPPSTSSIEPPAYLGSSLTSRQDAMAYLLAAGIRKDILMCATWFSFANRLCLLDLGRVRGKFLLTRLRSPRAQISSSLAPPGEWKPRLRLGSW
jgi:hypothetical protein